MNISHKSLRWALLSTTAVLLLAAQPVRAASSVDVNYDQLDNAHGTIVAPPTAYENARPISSPLTPNKPIVLKPLPEWEHAAVPAAPATPVATRAPIVLKPLPAQDLIRQLAAQSPVDKPAQTQIAQATNPPRAKLNLVPPPPKVPTAAPAPATQIALAPQAVQAPQAATVPQPKTHIVAIAAPASATVNSAPAPRTMIAATVAPPAEPQRVAQLAPPPSTIVQPEILRTASDTAVTPPPPAMVNETAMRPEDMHVAQNDRPAMPEVTTPPADAAGEVRAEDVVALDLRKMEAPGMAAPDEQVAAAPPSPPRDEPLLPMAPAAPTKPVLADDTLLTPPKKVARQETSQFMSSLGPDEAPAPSAEKPTEPTVTADATVAPSAPATHDEPQFTSSLAEDVPPQPSAAPVQKTAVKEPVVKAAPKEPAVKTAYDLDDIKTVKTLDVPASKTAAAAKDKANAPSLVTSDDAPPAPAAMAEAPKTDADDVKTVQAEEAAAPAPAESVKAAVPVIEEKPLVADSSPAKAEEPPPVETKMADIAPAKPEHVLSVPASKQQAENVTPVPATPSPDVSALRGEVTTANTRIAQAEEKITTLVNQQKDLEVQAAAGAEARQKADDLQKRLADAEKQAAQQQAELESLREARQQAATTAAQQIQTMPELDALRAQMTASEARVIQAEAEVARLRSEQEKKEQQQTTASNAAVAELKAQVIDNNARLTTAEAEATRLRTERNNAVEAAQKLQALQKQTASAAPQMQELQARVEAAENRVTQAEGEVDKLRSARDAAPAVAAPAVIETADAESLAAVRSKITAAEARIAQSEQSLKNLKTDPATTPINTAVDAAPPQIAQATAPVVPQPVIENKVSHLPEIIERVPDQKLAAVNTGTLRDAGVINNAAALQPVVVSFAPASSALNPQLQSYLDTVASQMKAQQGARLTLQAYANGANQAGSATRRMSLQRALTVRDYLNKQGVPVSRMNVQALGAAPDGNNPDRVDVLFN